MKEKTGLEILKEMAGEITLGMSLKIARELAGLSQSQLGKKFGKSAQFISDIENMRRSITFETVLNYAIHCEHSTAILLSKYYKYTLESSGLTKKYEVILKEIGPLKKSA